MTKPPTPSFMHATVVTVGECGILIEGPSGSGKSSLAAAILQAAESRGRFARLVGDDRVGLAACNGRLLAHPHPAIAGLLEQRGFGLVPMAHEPAALVRLAVRLVREPAELEVRLPDAIPTQVLCGITVPLVILPSRNAACDNARRVLAAMWALPLSREAGEGSRQVG